MKSKWAVMIDPEVWYSKEEYETKEEALIEFQKFLRGLSELHPITKVEEVFTNPGLDEYTCSWRIS